LVETIRGLLDTLPPSWSATITGQVLLLVDAQQTLVATQVESLALASLLIFAVIALGLRSWRLTATAVLPNLFPVLGVFALMVLLRLPLDAATVMVASIALGIAVDNTVHILEHVRSRRAAGVPQEQAIADTLCEIGPAMVATTATACVGFLTLCLSAFIPIRDFGLLASVTMLVALVADTLLLPAILMVRA
jgi:predicted RND superfamily exporter protein